MGLADFRSGNKVKRKSNFPPEVKSLVNLFKGCRCGQRPQNFKLSQILIAKWLAVWWLKHNGESLKNCDSNKEKPRY